MYLDKTIAVVVPAKNEAEQIEDVLTTMPDSVDKVYIVDDGSTDDTGGKATAWAEKNCHLKIEIIHHSQSRGVGGAIASGYARSRDDAFDISVVMAGDGQMDPDDFEYVIDPVATGKADYSKGNRFQYLGGIQKIPRVRFFGNFVLSVLTKIVSGYWHISDTQTGYTAITQDALKSIDVEGIYPSYGCPNDILIKLNIVGARVVEVPINPLYGVGEKSKMNVKRVIAPILMLLARGFVKRIFYRYLIVSGHPLVFGYILSILLFLSALILSFYLLVQFIMTGIIGKVALILAGGCTILGTQFLLNAFNMDYENNRHLYVFMPPDAHIQKKKI